MSAEPDDGPVSDARLERRIWLRVVVIGLIAFPFVAAINASSLITEASRAGVALDAHEPWLLELTSAAGSILLLPAVAALERRFPVVASGILRSLAVYLPASVVFSLLHTAVMVALRKLLVPVILGQPYVYFGPSPWADLVYEYRKDVFIVAVLIGLLTLSRLVEEGRQEAAAARADARRSGRLTLKSGGHTIHLDARDVQWAQSNGNYVELHADGKTHLPRITLADLEDQLRHAGIDVARVHRSRLLNRAVVAEVRPNRSGDMTIRLRDGTEIKGSRRYRDQLDGQ